MTRRNQVFVVICVFYVVSVLSCFSVQICKAPVAVGFGISADPSSLAIVLGESGQSVANVSAKGNLGTLLVDLSASSISGVSTDFDPQQVMIPPSSGEWNHNQSTLTITVSDTATPTVYTLTVYADFGPATRNVNITITILTRGYEDVTVGGHIVDTDTPQITTWTIAVTVVVAVLITVPHPQVCVGAYEENSFSY